MEMYKELFLIISIFLTVALTFYYSQNLNYSFKVSVQQNN